MSVNNKIGPGTITLILIALVGGVIGGYLSGVVNKDTRIESLSSAVITQFDSKDNEITILNEKVSILEEQLSQLEVGVETPVIGFNTPDFDSGWIEIERGEFVELNHNLGSMNLFVYLIGGSSLNDYDIHQHYYGGDIYRVPVIDFDEETGEGYYADFDIFNTGIYWHTWGENSIRVCRMDDDSGWPRFRVVIWELPEPPVVMMP